VNQADILDMKSDKNLSNSTEISPMGTGRNTTAVCLFILFLLLLNGCFLMMPFMIQPMLSGAMSKPQESEQKEISTDLQREGAGQEETSPSYPSTNFPDP
jgi:hypothetical protein